MDRIRIRHQSELCVPILADGKVIGLIDTEHPQKDFFTNQHLRILTTIASICANKLMKVRAKKAKEDTHHLMNELKARALRAQLSPHFVFYALNAIQHFISSDQKVKSIRFLSLFSKLIRYHLNNYEKDESLQLSVTRQAHTVKLEVIYGPVYLDQEPATREVNYQEAFLPWDEQSRLLSRIKGYTIKTDTEILPGDEPESNKIGIQLSLPILQMRQAP